MATLNLLTEAGVLLGALLFAGTDDIADGPSRRDCTVARLPAATTAEHELADVIAFAAGKIYRCNFRSNEGRVSILAHIHEGMTIVVTLRADGGCAWHVEKLFGRSAATGKCERTTGLDSSDSGIKVNPPVPAT